MKTSFCSIAYRHAESFDLPKMFAHLAAIGYDGVELWWPHLENLSSSGVKEVAACAAENSLVLPMISPYLGNYNLEMNNAAENLERAKAAAPVAASLGSPLLRAFGGWTCECSSLTASSEYWEYNLKGFKEMLAVARDFDLEIAIETHWGTLADSVEGVLKFRDFCGEGIKVNLQLDDIVANSGLESGSAVYRELGELVAHVHFPTELDGEKTEDYRGLFASMRTDGYDRFISLEHCSAEGDADKVAEEVFAKLTPLI
jgi:sugar phosphate isomerase/epimerase